MDKCKTKHLRIDGRVRAAYGRLYTVRKFTVSAAGKTNSSCTRQEFCLFYTSKLFVSSADKNNRNVYTTRFFSCSRQSGVGRASNNKSKNNDNCILL